MNIFKAIGLIILGFFFIIYTYKNPNKTFPAHNVGGYIGGITLIIVGILIIFNKISL